ncbi:Os07g0210550 [Oryza sativa Japonica Group]|uniref:Os07g0210550 protein n=1 Tax=Oryza sativa subsp. japonica TaxID=39947 RepID=A0A0P0X3P0_ORYSJ|nr:Os07g0210550 [Oryza sativa Japonica Group]
MGLQDVADDGEGGWHKQRLHDAVGGQTGASDGGRGQRGQQQGRRRGLRMRDAARAMAGRPSQPVTARGGRVWLQ